MKQFKLGDQLTVGGEKVRVDKISRKLITGILYHTDGVQIAGDFFWDGDGNPYYSTYLKDALVPMNSAIHDFKANWQDRLRGDYEYEIYAINRGGNYPIHGALYEPTIEAWFVVSWAIDGHSKMGIDTASDLLPVTEQDIPEKRDRVVYKMTPTSTPTFMTSKHEYTIQEWNDKWKYLTFICFLSDLEEWSRDNYE